jgi:hypothetical protein
MSQSNKQDDLALVSRALGGLPIINHVLDRLGLPGLLADVLPVGDARQKLAPAAAIRVAWSHGTSSAHRNRNQRNKSIP